MPSFTFWKNGKGEEAASRESAQLTTAAEIKFDPGNQDSGVFLLEEMGLDEPLSAPPVEIPAQETEDKHTAQETSVESSTIEPSTEPAEPENLKTPLVSTTLPEDTAKDTHGRERNSISLPATSPSPTAPQRANTSARRLHRPTELNLGTTKNDEDKPRSELEKRFDMIRNSKTQSKAALRSPTQLLRERLNMSPRKSKHEEVVRVFVPPKLSTTGCLLPGPGEQPEAFKSSSVRAMTESSGRPAWWCKVDKLVVFDGVEVGNDGSAKMMARTSKGLSISRRRGDTETIVIPLDCAHCQEMLHRHEWKYDIQICRRSVCWDCKERCKWEMEQEAASARGNTGSLRVEGTRYRADSVLQDDEMGEEELMNKIGIEQARPRSPIEAVGGIAERLGSVEIERS